MNKTRMNYFEQEDILHFIITEGPESNSVELSSNITAELNEQGELIGIEILNASIFLRDSILESVQAKVLSIFAIDHISEVALTYRRSIKQRRRYHVAKCPGHLS